MKQLVVYYSYTGDTAKLAAGLAEKRGCDLLEVKDASACPGKLRAYTSGLLAARAGKSWEIQPLALDLAEYDRVTIMVPVWAGGPVPQINSLLELLPGGKTVEMILVSGSGKSSCKQKLEDKLSERGCTMLGLQNVRANQAELLE